jgi:predicted transcriptional regulator
MTLNPLAVITATDIMTSHLITLRPEMTCQDAMQVLMNNRISGAPVVDTLGELVGVVSLKDLLENSEYQLPTPTYYEELYLDDILSEDEFELVNLNSGTLAEVMTPNVVTVKATTSVECVAQALYTQKVHRVIVVSNDQPVGIISTFDVLKAIAGGSIPSTHPTKVPAGMGV